MAKQSTLAWHFETLLMILNKVTEVEFQKNYRKYRKPESTVSLTSVGRGEGGNEKD